MLIDANVNVVMISKRMGHANPNVALGTYSHLFRNDDSSVAETIDRMLAGK
jgi:hypothetical protein